jgi:hypothetical protein
MRSVLDSRQLILGLLLMMSPIIATEADSRVKYASSNESFVIVKGTSSLHDWSVRGDQIDGFAELKEMIAGLSLGDIFALTSDSDKPVVHVSVSADSLKSDKKAMDKKMYEALKVDQFPRITYELTSISAAEMKDPSHLTLKTAGTLTITGVSRPLEMTVQVEVSGQNAIIFEGNTRLKMTDFQIKPPKAMLGMLKTGDEVEISFKWIVRSPSAG